MSNPNITPPARTAGKIKLTRAVPVGHASAPPAVPAEQRHARIAVAAYYIAERRGFEAGHELEDWLLAESEIDNAPLRGAPARS